MLLGMSLIKLKRHFLKTSNESALLIADGYCRREKRILKIIIFNKERGNVA